VAREELAGVEGDDRDLVLVDDGEDLPPGMGCADPQGVNARTDAEQHLRPMYHR
jgi:hypothetical protein